MKTIDQIPVTDPDTEALLQSISTGQPLPTEIRDRLREEGRKITQALREKHGDMNIAVDLIRQTRDE